MSNPFAPDTVDVATQIAVYLTGLLDTNSNPIYTAGQIGEYKSLALLLPANGANVIFEVYGNMDDSQRYTLGGKMKDHQSFFILSLLDKTNGNAAELQIMRVRDAIMPIFAKHAQLGAVGNILVAKYKSGTGRFVNVSRAAKEYRGHVFEVEVKTEWNAQGGFTA